LEGKIEKNSGTREGEGGRLPRNGNSRHFIKGFKAVKEPKNGDTWATYGSKEKELGSMKIEGRCAEEGLEGWSSFVTKFRGGKRLIEQGGKIRDLKYRGEGGMKTRK